MPSRTRQGGGAERSVAFLLLTPLGHGASDHKVLMRSTALDFV